MVRFHVFTMTGQVTRNSACPNCLLSQEHGKQRRRKSTATNILELGETKYFKYFSEISMGDWIEAHSSI
jgi:hypothetical protein